MGGSVWFTERGSDRQIPERKQIPPFAQVLFCRHTAGSLGLASGARLTLSAAPPAGWYLHESVQRLHCRLAMLLLLAALAALGAGLAAASWAQGGVARSESVKLSIYAGAACWFGTPPQLTSCAFDKDTCVITCLHLPCRAPHRLCLQLLSACAGKLRSRRPTPVEAGALAAARRHGIELLEEIGSGVHSKVYRGDSSASAAALAGLIFCVRLKSCARGYWCYH